jgi:hypothetical protein
MLRRDPTLDQGVKVGEPCSCVSKEIRGELP